MLDIDTPNVKGLSKNNIIAIGNGIISIVFIDSNNDSDILLIIFVFINELIVYLLFNKLSIYVVNFVLIDVLLIKLGYNRPNINSIIFIDNIIIFLLLILFFNFSLFILYNIQIFI